MTCVAGAMYQPYSTSLAPTAPSPYLPPSTAPSSYLSPPPLTSSPSQTHYQEQTLPLKRELVDAVRIVSEY